MTNTLSLLRTVAGMLLAATALAGARPAAAADSGLCGGLIAEVAVPGNWRKTVTDGFVSYRAPSSIEALTAAAYALKNPAARSEILLKSAELRRRTESRQAFAAATARAQWVGRPLVLSAIRQEHDGDWLQICWSGEEIATKRKFLSVTSSWGDVMHHFYYQAVGVSAGEFNRRAAAIFQRPSAGALETLIELERVMALGSAANLQGAR